MSYHPRRSDYHGLGQAPADPPDAEDGQNEAETDEYRCFPPLKRPVAIGGLVGHHLVELAIPRSPNIRGVKRSKATRSIGLDHQVTMRLSSPVIAMQLASESSDRICRRTLHGFK